MNLPLAVQHTFIMCFVGKITKDKDPQEQGEPPSLFPGNVLF